MKFYNREKEIKIINEIVKKSKKSGQLIVLQGKRRVGKTALILHTFKKQNFLYFFVSKKTEKELLDDFKEEISKKLDLPYLGEFKSLKHLLEFLFDYSKKNNLIVVFDEFQNFKIINPSLFSDLQKFWDLNKDKSKIAIFCIGSMFTLIKKIFTSSKEPLYDRANKIIELKPFDLKIQQTVLKDFKLLSPKNFLVFYSFFNGMPKYFELIEDNDLRGKDVKQIIKKLFCEEDAYLIKEGKNILIEEFGRSYEKYFSVLTAIALGKTTKNEIYNYTGININSLGVLLKTLEDFYEIVERKTPVLEKKASSKLSSYKIKDEFLSFWFRYIYKKNYLIEIKNWQAMFNYIDKDLDNYLGFKFENLVRDYLIEQNNSKNNIFDFEQIGSFWKRPDLSGDNKEIDIVAVSKESKTALIGECKLNFSKVDQSLVDNLIRKSKFVSKLKNYKKVFYIFTVEELPKEKKKILAKNDFKFLSLENVLKKL
ncbi:MAG: DUF234 domain-containing protein [Patescibacteria group bacterium]|nr:DUF234 domain-containing protein [Patescibacteria group bacterium]